MPAFRILLFTAAFPLGLFAGSDSPPSWVQESSTRIPPPYSAKVSSAALLNEQHMTVDAGGKVVTHYRRAIKILTRDGRDDAVAAVHYLTRDGKVKEMHAWLLTPGGFVKSYKKEDVVDLGSFGDDMYDEYRLKLIRANLPEVGSVFAYEADVEEKSVFTQELFAFQQRLPSLESRFVLTLPAGWTAKGVLFNHDPIQPLVEGSTYTWEVKNLPFIETEEEGPETDSLAPRLAVTFFPPGDASGSGPVLRSWADVSRWLTELSTGQDEQSAELVQKAKELTAGAVTEYDKIRAIGTYVQKVKYVSIQTGLARGGGYRPHPAGMVFKKQYGDCKDKANLMRSMLEAAGISSYLISIYSGDRDYVRQDWPSPLQFNHAIIAVRISDTTKAPTVLDGAALGRLLIFDPTDEHTPVGDLPFYEQGSYALIEAGEKGLLARMPVTPEGTNHEEISVNGTLAASGALQASFSSRAQGQDAAESRRHFEHRQRPDYIKDTERWFGRSAKGVVVEKVEPVDSFATGEFKLDVEFNAPAYAQSMQGRMLVFRPSVVNPRNQVYLAEDKRTTPVVLDARSFHKQVNLKLPEDFKVDEMPDNGSLKTRFGTYRCEFKVNGNELLFTEDLNVEPMTVPASEYSSVKKFFQQVWSAEQAPIVLVKN